MISIVFFGSDRYSAIVLQTLLDHPELHLSAVITDRSLPKDREQKIVPNPVESLAISHNINVSYYPTNNEEKDNLIDLIKSLTPTHGVAASFDHLIPAEIISLFPYGILNVHPSLLPQYRNVSPVQYAIAMGDIQTGVSVFKITPGIDNGKIIGQTVDKIGPEDTTPILSERLFPLGAQIVVDYLLTNKITQQPAYDNSQPLIFTRRLTRDSGYLEWPVIQELINNKPIESNITNNHLLKKRLEINPLIHNSSSIIHDLVRALTPWPGVWSLVPTSKGELRISIDSVKPEIKLKIAGKPKAISLNDFTNYYLNA